MSTKTPDEKKKRERAILDLVYSDESFASITPDEEPDFKLKHKFDGPEFGVEVTEFYFSESRARIINIPGYVSEIISKGEYKHKDDITSLGVKELTLIPGDKRKSQRKIRGILQEQPNIDKYVDKVSKLIKNKNKKVSKYVDGLDHVNLIIFDYENGLINAPTDKFHFYFFKPKLEKALTNSGFREIFFVTKIGSFQSLRYVYIPLKMLFLVAEAYRFSFIMVKEYSGESQKYTDKEPALFAEFLKWRGAKDIQCKDNSTGYEVAYGNSGIFIAKDNKISIRDYNDYSLPNDLTLVNNTELSRFFDKKFRKIFNESKKTYIFSTELHFNTKKNFRNH